MASKITASQDEHVLAGADIVQPLTSRSLFWQANYLTGGAATDMLSFLFWCVESTSPRVLVSLTRNSGESYFAMCQAVERLSLDTRCFNIAPGTLTDAVRTHNANNFEDFSILLESTPQDAAARLAEHSIDLLYIDLAHLSKDLLKNLEVWKSKLSPRSVLLLHGVRNPDLADTCRECLTQLGIKAIDFTLEHGAGMGVVLNPETPSRLVRLAQMGLGQPGYAEVQKVFFRLGKAQQNAYLVRNAEHVRSQLNADIIHMRKQAKQAQTEADAAVQKADKLRTAYEARNQHFALVEARHFDTVSKLQDTVETLQESHDARTGELEHMRRQFEDNTVLNAKVSDLEAQISSLNKKNAALENQKLDLAKQLPDPQSILEDQTRIEELHDTVQRQDEELASLVQNLEEMRIAYEDKLKWLRDTLAKAKADTQKTDHLTAQIKTLHSEIAELISHREAQTDELVTLTNMLETQAAQRSAHQEWQAVQIELRDAEIAMLRNAGGRLKRGDMASRAGLPSVKKQIQIVRDSNLFDAAWYLETYKDVAQSGADPAQHYVTHGVLDGRNPGPAFDTMGYYLANRDVAQRGFNALVHYTMFGRDENRKLSNSS